MTTAARAWFGGIKNPMDPSRDGTLSGATIAASSVGPCRLRQRRSSRFDRAARLTSIIAGSVISLSRKGSPVCRDLEDERAGIGYAVEPELVGLFCAVALDLSLTCLRLKTGGFVTVPLGRDQSA